MNVFSIKRSRFDSSFKILYPWLGRFTIAQYNNCSKKFLVRRPPQGQQYYKIFSLSENGKIRIGKRQVSSHRMVASIIVGSEFPSSYEVHHIDHNHNNDNPENLVIVTREQHVLLHRMLRESIAKYYNKNSIDGFIEYQLLIEKIKKDYSF